MNPNWLQDDFVLQPLVSLLRVVPGCPVHLGKRQWAASHRRPRAVHRARRLPSDLKPLRYNSEPWASIVCEFPWSRKKCFLVKQFELKEKPRGPTCGVRNSSEVMGKKRWMKGRSITASNVFSSNLTFSVTLTQRDRNCLLCLPKIEFSLQPRRNSQVLPGNALLCRLRILFFSNKWHAVRSPSKIWSQDGEVEIPIVHCGWLISLCPPGPLLSSRTQRAPHVLVFFFPYPNINIGCAIWT